MTEKGQVEEIRKRLTHKNRIVVKIGSSSLQHPETQDLDYIKLEKLVRELCDLRNQGKEVVLVTSGAIAVGKKALLPLGQKGKTELSFKQACAAVGQARLMTTYQKLFAEYNQIVAQILMTKNTVVDEMNSFHAKNTFSQLLSMGIIPIVNENDTIATYEIRVNAENDTLIGDNDTLSAVVAALVEADLLILLSDIDGLYTDDPRKNPDAKLIEVVEALEEQHFSMAKESTGSTVGTGGMNTKLIAANISTHVGTDLVIANSREIGVIHEILQGKRIGTLFLSHKEEDFQLREFVRNLHHHE